jgi:hypothetical protein
MNEKHQSGVCDSAPRQRKLESPLIGLDGTLDGTALGFSILLEPFSLLEHLVLYRILLFRV